MGKPNPINIRINNKNNPANMHIEYDLIRWPQYKELIYRKRNIEVLAYDATKV